jgi:nicotinamidase-related amidase
MTQQDALDFGRAVVLAMDLQEEIVTGVAADPQRVVSRAARVLGAARAAGVPVVYVVHRGGRFEAGGPGAEIQAGLRPADGERVIVKTKTGPFSTTGLEALLRECSKDTLVLMGVATSGCVLSAVRWAADVGYRLAVVADACDDRDPEVHRVLTEKVFPRQATVMTTDEFAAAVGAR